MKKVLLHLLCLSSILLANFLGSGESQIDSICQQCIESNPSTMAIVHCYGVATESWDSVLNREYSQLMEILDEEQREKLRDAQREWISFRDHMIESFYFIYGKNDGTIWKAIIAEEKMKLTKAQALRLIFLETDNGEEL